MELNSEIYFNATNNIMKTLIDIFSLDNVVENFIIILYEAWSYEHKYPIILQFHQKIPGVENFEFILMP